MPYDMREQFENRLVGTVVRHSGRAFYVTRAYDDLTIRGSYLDSTVADDNQVRISGTDPLLDVSSAPVGNLVLGPNVYFCRRVAVTSRQQGLSSRNVEVLPILGGRGVLFDPIAYGSAISDMILGVYPEPPEELRPGESYALDRHYAVSGGEQGIGHLYYRGSRIAYTEDGGSTFVLPSAYSYYREMISTTLPQLRIA